MPTWLIPIEAYLLGSIPFGFLLYRWRTGGDIRARGSGNIGATNVLRTAGVALGLLTLVLDAAKGYVALAFADYLSYHPVSQPYVFMKTGANVPAYHYGWIALALILTLVGHVFTPWLRFRGGKGVATALGLFLALAPRAAAWTVLLFLVVLALSRFVSLASLVAAVAFPLLLWWRYGAGYPPVVYAAVIVAVLLIIARHRGNIVRLRAGREPRLGRRIPAAPGMVGE